MLFIYKLSYDLKKINWIFAKVSTAKEIQEHLKKRKDGTCNTFYNKLQVHIKITNRQTRIIK